MNNEFQFAQARSTLDTRRGALKTLAIWGVALLSSPALLWINASVISLTGIPDCPLHWITGFNCALCGGTRCVMSIVRGDLSAAFWYNPLAVAGGIGLALIAGWILICCIRKNYRRPWPRKYSGYGLWIGAAVMVAFFILRNLPFYRESFY